MQLQAKEHPKPYPSQSDLNLFVAKWGKKQRRSDVIKPETYFNEAGQGLNVVKCENILGSATREAQESLAVFEDGCQQEQGKSSQETSPGVKAQGSEIQPEIRFLLQPNPSQGEQFSSEQLVMVRVDHVYSLVTPQHMLEPSSVSKDTTQLVQQSQVDATTGNQQRAVAPVAIDGKLQSYNETRKQCGKSVLPGTDLFQVTAIEQVEDNSKVTEPASKAGSELADGLPRGLHHLTRHWIPDSQRGIAVLQTLGAADMKQADQMIKSMGQRDLRHAFQKVYHCETQSYNNNWLRRKLLEAVGVRATPGPRHSRSHSSSASRPRLFRPSTHRPADDRAAGTSGAPRDDPPSGTKTCTSENSKTITRKAAVAAAEADAVAALQTMMAGGMEGDMGWKGDEGTAGSRDSGEAEQIRTVEMPRETAENASCPCLLKHEGERNADASREIEGLVIPHDGPEVVIREADSFEEVCGDGTAG